MIRHAVQEGLKSIVVTGPGAEAAAVAVALGVSLGGSEIKITLVTPSAGRSSAGVARIRGGESGFHSRLGVDEQELMRATCGVYSLGTRFSGFAGPNESIFVPLGKHGMTIRLVPFHQYWCNLCAADEYGQYNEYSLPAASAARGRFVPPKSANDPVNATVTYDLLVDLDLYALFFVKLAGKLGITILNDSVSAATVGPDGQIEQLQLAGGAAIDGDFFIDCLSERLPIDALGGASCFEDWSEWLPCNRILSVLTRKQREPALFTSIKAVDQGWLQRNTLQNFTVESLTCCNDYLDDTGARQILEESLPHSSLSSVEQTTYRCGRFRASWIGNCVAIGSAAIAIEALNVSSLQLAQNAVLRLLAMLPVRGESAMLAQEFNRVTAEEHIGVRDYAILHYQLAIRPSTPFWLKCRNARVPDTIVRRLELYRENGRISTGENEWFGADDWLSCMINFGVLPEKSDPLVAMAESQQVRSSMLAFRETVRQIAEAQDSGAVPAVLNDWPLAP
jgi:tryptophan halogenase